MFVRDFQCDVRDNRFHYDIYNLSNLKDGEHKIVNGIYELWQRIWYEVFNCVQSLESLKGESLLHQACLGVVSVDGEVVGFNYLNSFDMRLQYQMESSYLRPFFPEIETHRFLDGVRRMHSIEYLTALPKMRKVYSNVSIGEILIRFSVHYSRSRNFDMLLGSTRSDIGVTKTAERAGFQPLGKSIMKCSYPCDLVYYPLLKEPSEKNPELADLVSQVWQSTQNRIHL